MTLNKYKKRGFIDTELMNFIGATNPPPMDKETSDMIVKTAKMILDGLSLFLPDFIIEWIKNFISAIGIVIIASLTIITFPLALFYAIVKIAYKLFKKINDEIDNIFNTLSR
ncbi:hypothetical protein [Sulfurimonas paralvinellae]|uniref:Uncharacterized protein n=1 Tax=Sulfurimonas paralvinellae TaxID=317658 RepID=A0A7M1B999_9BACT|nr:hypothetical protein [Sulfurimonas paralvinellae]QOP46290.1 hypothetical protein FM071_08295 [Sulfurimonas paralvinellae]